MIRIYNRKTAKYDIEKVAGEKYIKWTYESPLGKSLLELFIKRKLFSKIYGFYCNTKFSKRKIKPFINSFSIDMSKCADSIDTYRNFNDFFTRKLLPEARPFEKNSNILISPGDGRLLAYTNISMENLVQVKNIHYSLAELLEDSDMTKDYEGGTCLVLRLCPTDYHRFHFIDNGMPLENHFIKGNYYSVNPTALERVAKLYCQNKREWSIFKSENFGDIIHVEVGATCVGSIIQSYSPHEKVSKGDEKGYFKYGGSTTILFFKPGTVEIDEDILIQSSLSFETAVQMGEKIGVKSPSAS